MGESDLLLGPHGEGGTEHRGIGIHGDRARCPLWSSLCSMGLEDAKSPPRRQAPSTHLACEHARIEEGVTEIVEPPRSQRWLLPPQRTSQKGSPHTPTPIRG
jgi:hypothetical protein